MATCPSCKAPYAEGVLVCPTDGTRLAPADAVAPEPDLAPGAVAGEYHIERKLGQGGFGTVYEAVHPLIGKQVAVKVLRRAYADSADVVARFVAEARAVNRIGHRGIIDIFGFGKLEDGRVYYVMELLKGRTLKAHLDDKRRLTVEQGLAIVREIARALDAAHAAGIAHRDLKPENVLLADDGEGGFSPKLLDFGIAKLLGPATAKSVTQSGTPMGTPLYMSPEQCRGKQVDHRTDLYALGVLTHELLTGKPPFVGDDVLDLMMKQATAAPPPMSSVRADLPAELDKPVLQLLEKDPAKRPASAGAAFEALAQAAARAGRTVPPPSGGPRLRLSDPGGGPVSARAVDEGPTEPMPEVAQSLLGSAKEVVPSRAPARRRRTALVVAGAVAAGALAVVLVRSASGPAAGSPPPTSTGDRATSPAAPAPEAPATVAAASAAPSADPAVAEIEIRFEGAPAGAEVRRDGKLVGPATAPLRLPRAAGAVSLVIEAEGFEPQTVRVVPSADSVVALDLKRKSAAAKAGGAAKATAAPKAMGEIENPFR